MSNRAPIKVARTNLSWSTVAEWIALVYQVGGTVRASTKHYERCDRLYRSLTVADVRSCCNQRALAYLEKLFDQGRYRDIPGGHGIGRCYSRPAMGIYLVEVRNRLDALQSGRKSRIKGPRFDVTRLPDTVLERLIQRHPDMAVVEQLRAERVRRLLPASLQT